MVRKDVFISYKAEEYQEARWVRLALESQGISCWMAPESIRGGASYASEIPAAIRGCKAFVLILSEKAQESKWVPRELDQAINDNKVIMPFMIENCALKDEFGFYLTNVQRYAAYEGKEAALERMTADIMELLGIVKPAEPVPPVKAVPPMKPMSPARPVQQVQERPESTVPSSAQSDESAKRNKKKPGVKKILLIACAVIVFAVVFALVFRESTTVMIAGERFDKSEQYLYLRHTELTVEDMQSIAQMKELITLYLEDCAIPHQRLGEILGEKLQVLVLSECSLSEEQIESIDLSGLSLTRFDISGSANFKTLEPLEAVSSTLQHLDISNTSVTDLSTLQSFSKLSQLNADNNGISDISALSSCMELYQVSLNGNEISDLSAFDVCTNLSEVSVNENELMDLKGLEHCIKLSKICAKSNRLNSLDGLVNATLLHTADLRDNQLEDASVLGKSAASLKNVYLGNNAIADISFLENCTELARVNLDHNKVTTLKALANASQLESVTAQGNQILNTEGIEGKEKLMYLNLADNGLLDVGVETPVTFKASDGAVLDLSGNKLRTINISYANKFRLLVLSDYEVPKDSFLYDSNGSYVVFDYGKDMDFAALAEREYYEYVVVGCPLDQQVNTEKVLGSYNTTFVDNAEEYYTIEDYLPNYVMGD